MLRTQPDGLLDELITETRNLDLPRATLLREIIQALRQPIDSHRLSGSDVVTAEFDAAFGPEIQLHHATATGAMTKKHFERSFERALRISKRKVQVPEENNPGRDLTVDGVGFSLKTQADKRIKADEIWISKFMELGKGEWGAELSDLASQRDRLVEHLQDYERIFTLRSFRLSATLVRYELIEIPKCLLQESLNGTFSFGKVRKSKSGKERKGSRPGYCTVFDGGGGVKFQLYFDGWGERKLHVKALRRNLCIVHGEWRVALAHPTSWDADSEIED